MQGRIWVGTAHTFDEGGGHIIVPIPALVIGDHLLLNALCRDCQIDMNGSVRAWRRGQGGQLQPIVGVARIAAAHIRQML